VTASFQNWEQRLTKFVNFWNSRREFSNSREFPPGIPGMANSQWWTFTQMSVSHRSVRFSKERTVCFAMQSVVGFIGCGVNHWDQTRQSVWKIEY